jgi:hypothetical protein
MALEVLAREIRQKKKKKKERKKRYLNWKGRSKTESSY